MLICARLELSKNKRNLTTEYTEYTDITVNYEVASNTGSLSLFEHLQLKKRHASDSLWIKKKF